MARCDLDLNLVRGKREPSDPIASTIILMHLPRLHHRAQQTLIEYTGITVV